MIDQVIDQAERLQALDPFRSFIVQAPAGSGKTELLIQRFLTLLANVDHPEAIVAVTFTRKAAGEMRHRIVEALQDAARVHGEPVPLREHQQQTRELSYRALARDKERGWQLIEHPSRLRIQTLDALCGMLVRQMPWLSRMGAGAPPEENAFYLYREAARQTIGLLRSNDNSADAMERLLRHLDNNVGNAERLLTGMLASRDRWLRHVVPHLGFTEQLRSDLQHSMRQIIAGELESLRSQFPEPMIAETATLADFAARNLQSHVPESDLTHCAGMTGLPRAHVDDIAKWRGIASLLLTEKGERRKALSVNNGFPPKPDCRAEKQRCLKLEFPAEFIQALHAIRSLPPDGFNDSQWEVLGALIELLPVAAAQLRVVFQDAGKVDFTEIAHASSMALGTRDNPTDLAFALDCRIQHLLVDEFQDTSRSQFELLEKLTAEWQSGDGRSLFLVGDPMQSIYGFREAEVGLFRQAQEQGIGGVALTPLTLKVNFRSSAGIVRWVNDAVGAAFPLQTNKFQGAVTYEPSVAFDKGTPAPAIHVHPSIGDDRELEASKVLSIIRESRNQNPDGSIAVLVRARSHLPAIVNALRQANEKFTAVDIDPLGSRSVVQDLLALTSALLHPGDRTAWLALLRAPWCGLTLADLLALAGDDFKSVIASLWNQEARLAAMSADGRFRLERVKPILSDAMAKRGRLQLRRWVESTWLALGGPACLEDRTGLEDAAVFFDLLESSASGSELKDPLRFLDDVGGLFARPDVRADGKVQLLTIHKAKGLEFDTVILPGLGRTAKTEESRLLLWLEYLDSNEHSQLLLAPIKETGSDSDAAYAYVQKVLNARTANESTRLLYVAATRARSNLHILGHTKIDANSADSNALKPPPVRSLLHHVWKSLSAEFEEFIRQAPQPQISASDENVVQVPLRRLVSGWTGAAPPADVRWNVLSETPVEEDGSFEHVSFDWATELQRRVGIVVHAMLQQMDGLEVHEIRTSTIEAALSAEGLSDDRLREGIVRVERALHSTLSDPRGRWILDMHEEDQREFPLTGIVGGRVRRFILDRTFVESGHRWIIDYKTGMHEGGSLDAFLDNEQERYRPQLENYGTLLAQMDSRPVRLGLYFPMLQAWREWS